MEIKEAENELIITETPGCLWIFGLFFALVGGIFVYGALGGFTNRDQISPLVIILTFFMGAGGVAAGIWIVHRAPLTKIIFDQRMETVVYTKFGLAGKQQNIYAFAEVKQFCLVETLDSERDPIWSLGMELASGETIVISALQSHDEKYKRAFVFQINQFLRKQMPSYNANPEIGD